MAVATTPFSLSFSNRLVKAATVDASVPGMGGGAMPILRIARRNGPLGGLGLLYTQSAMTIGQISEVAVLALMPLVEKYGKVFIGQGGHMKSFEQGFTYSFGSPPLMGEWSYLSISGLFDDLIPKAQWPKTAALLTMNNVIGLSSLPTVTKALADRGVKITVNETYNLPLSDATPLASKAKGTGAELIIIQGFFDDTVMIMRAAKRASTGCRTPALIFSLTRFSRNWFMRSARPSTYSFRMPVFTQASAISARV